MLAAVMAAAVSEQPEGADMRQNPAVAGDVRGRRCLPAQVWYDA
eukprot:COSAG01_NODE_30_length_36127_cov_41.433234_19_plen_44_part_00